MALEGTGRHGSSVGLPVTHSTHILLRFKGNIFSPLDDVNSPQGRGFITSPMGPLGKVSSGGRSIPFVQGLGWPTRPSFPAEAVAAGGAVFIRPPAGATVIGMGVDGEDMSGPGIFWQGRVSSADRHPGLV